ncbi:hypothetical protein NXV73_21320 [Bacteroides salyersiae]|nr:hypothetical protein [Bacteroides salyersiae]
MKQGKKLLILPAVAVLLGMGTGCSDNSENKARGYGQKGTDGFGGQSGIRKDCRYQQTGFCIWP